MTKMVNDALVCFLYMFGSSIVHEGMQNVLQEMLIIESHRRWIPLKFVAAMPDAQLSLMWACNHFKSKSLYQTSNVTYICQITLAYT